MSESALDRDAVFATLPPVWPQPLLDEIRRRNDASGKRLVILDDDPTGAQTSHGVPVLTRWTHDSLVAELERSTAFFLLTNSRALEEPAAVAVAHGAGLEVREAAQAAGRDVLIASRSDSTLRGHFPAEADALAGAAFQDTPPVILFVPYFAEGGRFTIDDTQYVLQGDRLVPAAETEFARDHAFAYEHSYLPSWVEEKTKGRVKAADVVSVTLGDLRAGGPDAVAKKLGAVPEGGVVVANAADDRDIEVLVMGLIDAEAEGKRFLCRTAASFIRVRAGITTRPLLTADELSADGRNGGLIVAGSHVDRTSEQLGRLFASRDVTPLEVDVDALLGLEHEARAEVARCSIIVSSTLAAGQDVVLFTSRTLRRGLDPQDGLAVGRAISRRLCEIVRGLMETPRFLIAKGGNTASDLATNALGVQRAMVLGQLLPGVPVWELGPESKFPGLRYVVFPGNVGGPDALADAIAAFE